MIACLHSDSNKILIPAFLKNKYFVENSEKFEKYYRELDVSTAVSKVNYSVNGVNFTREYFVSAPDKILVIKLTSSKKGALNFTLNTNSFLNFKTVVEGNTFKMKGRAPMHENAGYEVPSEYLKQKEKLCCTQQRNY